MMLEPLQKSSNGLRFGIMSREGQVSYGVYSGGGFAPGRGILVRYRTIPRRKVSGYSLRNINIIIMYSQRV